jgi:hypothetical protein
MGKSQFPNACLESDGPVGTLLGYGRSVYNLAAIVISDELGAMKQGSIAAPLAISGVLLDLRSLTETDRG